MNVRLDDQLNFGPSAKFWSFMCWNEDVVVVGEEDKAAAMK